ncbi:MAG: hypothetical protein ACYSTI_13020 [Planctomycetota bacterium]
MEHHDVLCGCGWGRMNCPEDQIPERCPQCNFNLWEYSEEQEEEEKLYFGDYDDTMPGYTNPAEDN